MTEVATPSHTEASPGEIYELFYRRTAGDGFNREDFKLALENWNIPGRISVQSIEHVPPSGFVHNPRGGYNARVLVRDPAPAHELFTGWIVTAQHGEPGFGEFQLESWLLVDTIWGPIADMGQAWDEAVGWLTTGKAREAVFGVVEDVGETVGRAVGGSAQGFSEEFGPLKTGALVIGTVAAVALLIRNT